MEVVVVRVGDQNQINRRNLTQRDARLTDPFLKAEPPRPYRVGNNVHPFILQKKVECPIQVIVVSSRFPAR